MNTKPLSLSIRMTFAALNVNLKCDVFNDLIMNNSDQFSFRNF